MTDFTFFLFGVLLVSAFVSMAKIHSQERADARESKRAHDERLAALCGKSFRPDGD